MQDGVVVRRGEGTPQGGHSVHSWPTYICTLCSIFGSRRRCDIGFEGKLICFGSLTILWQVSNTSGMRKTSIDICGNDSRDSTWNWPTRKHGCCSSDASLQQPKQHTTSDPARLTFWVSSMYVESDTAASSRWSVSRASRAVERFWRAPRSGSRDIGTGSGGISSVT